MKHLAAAAILITLGGTAWAQDTDIAGTGAGAIAPTAYSPIEDRTGFGVNVGFSTLGFTIEPHWRISDRFGVRAPFGIADVAFSDTFDGREYDGDVDLGGIGLLGDIYPFDGKVVGGMRLTGGVFYTRYGAVLVQEDFDLGFGMTTDITATVDQRRDFSPYAGFGYDGRFGKNGIISLDIGAMFGDGFSVVGSEDTGLVDQDVVDAEVAAVREEFGDLEIVPYAKVAIGFSF